MSRGPGHLQEWILAELQRGGDSHEVQMNELCWFLALREGKVLSTGGGGQGAAAGTGGKEAVGLCGLPAGEIKKPFYQSFNRAVRGLIATRRVNQIARKLRSLDELVRYYPYKTTDRWMKELRERLLPIAKQFAEKSDRRYSTADNEWYLLASVPDAVCARWPAIEAELFDLMGALGQLPEERRASRRRLIQRAAVRGRELFEKGSDVSCRSSLGSIVAEMREVSPTSRREGDAYEALAAFYSECFPPDDVARVDLKTQLMSVVDFGNRGASSVKLQFKHELLRAAPELIERMPDYVPAPTAEALREMDFWDRPRDPVPVFDPLLDKLIQRDASTEFIFLRLTPPVGMPARARGRRRPNTAA